MNMFERVRLVEEALTGDLTDKEVRKLLEDLFKKHWHPGIESHEERIVLCAYLRHDNKKDRIRFIEEEMKKLKKNLSIQKSPN